MEPTDKKNPPTQSVNFLTMGCSNDDSVITTTDNPYSPFSDWNRWHGFDEDKGYRTCERLWILADLDNEADETPPSQKMRAAQLKLVSWSDSFKNDPKNKDGFFPNWVIVTPENWESKVDNPMKTLRRKDLISYYETSKFKLDESDPDSANGEPTSLDLPVSELLKEAEQKTASDNKTD